MATGYGDYAGSGGYGVRAIIEATVSNSSDATSKVSFEARAQSNTSSTSISYGQSRVRRRVGSGSWVTVRTDYPVSINGSGTKTFSDGSFNVTRQYGEAQTVTVEHWFSSPNGSGALQEGSTATVKVTVPARPYDEPAAPSGCSASRASDSQAKVTWDNGATSTARPRSSTKVERQVDGGKWAQVASVGASVESWTDNTVSANHQYRYRVRAYGSGGYSSYATSGYVYTTPAAPASVSVAVVTGTTCSVDVDGSNAEWATSWEVQSQLNGGEWEAVGSFEAFPQVVDLGGGTVKVRARAVRGSLASAWVESAVVATITPPLAPTVSLSPSGVAPTGSVVTASWVPSHPDGSAQTSAEVEYTIGDGSPQTATVQGAATTYQLPESATASAATISVRVRTHGADEDWGAWSEPASLTVAVPPSAHLTSPAADGAVVDALPLVVEWEAEDATGVSSQELALLDADDGRVLHTARLDGAARSYVLSSATYRLSNLESYELRLVVSGGSTLATTATRSFATDFAQPATPQASLETDEGDLSVSITVAYGSEEGAPPAVTADVVRVLPDGSTWVVQSGVADGETVVDPLPPLNVTFEYEVTVTAESGAQATLSVPCRVGALVGAFNFGAAAGTCELARLNPDWSHDVARAGTLYHFADGGEAGGLPVAYGGQDVDATRSMGFTLLDLDQLRRLQELARTYFTCWYRDPYGGRALCAVSWSFSSGVPYDLLKVSASMTETVFEEAW